MLSNHDVPGANKATSQSYLYTKYKVANKHDDRTSTGLEVILQRCNVKEAMR